MYTSKKTVMLKVAAAIDREYPMTPSKLSNNLYFSINDALLNSLSPESRKLLSEPQNYTFKLNFAVLDHQLSNGEKPLFIDKRTVSLNSSDQIVIGLTGKLETALQYLFPFTEAYRILGEEIIPESLQESFVIRAIPASGGSDGGWVLMPKKRTDVSDKRTAEENALIQCMLRYGNKPHANPQTKSSEKKHANRVVDSTEWRDACEFQSDVTTWKNSIYTLASAPDQNGQCTIYIGEAIKSGKRLRQVRIKDGTVCIDHTKAEAEAHRFTRFRVDRLDENAQELLHDAQDLAIGIAMLLSKECPNGYTLTNSAKAKAYGKALNRDTLSRKQKK